MPKVSEGRERVRVERKVSRAVIKDGVKLGVEEAVEECIVPPSCVRASDKVLGKCQQRLDGGWHDLDKEKAKHAKKASVVDKVLGRDKK